MGGAWLRQEPVKGADGMSLWLAMVGPRGRGVALQG